MSEFAKNMENQNFDDWLRTVNLRNGGVHFVSGKGYGKSTALKHVARFYAQQPDTTVIICDTILNWSLSFDTCYFYTVKESDVQAISKNIEIEEGKSYLTWAKEYKINPEPFIFLEDMIKRKQRLILYDLELQEIDLVGIFQAKIIDWLYQKQRIKKKYWKGKIPEQYVLISEETEAVFDNTFDRRILNRTRKQFAEMANLRIAMFSCSQRLQEISTKFRGKMDSYLIGHTSIEDFDLKLDRMLKFSKHRKDVLALPKGIFLDTKSDTLVKFPDFEPNGTPALIPPKQPQPKAEPKLTLGQKLKKWLNEAKERKQQAKLSRNSETTKEPIHDISYGEDSWENEDDQYREEVW